MDVGAVTDFNDGELIRRFRLPSGTFFPQSRGNTALAEEARAADGSDLPKDSQSLPVPRGTEGFMEEQRTRSGFTLHQVAEKQHSARAFQS